MDLEQGRLPTPSNDSPPTPVEAPHIALTGGTSLVGRAVATALEGHGARVTRLNRVQEVKAIRRLDAVVHLSGAGVSESRWTDEFKARLRQSRVAETEALALAVRQCEVPPSVVVIGSSTAIYGDRGDDVCSEQEGPGVGFLAGLSAAVEAIAADLDGPDTRVVAARLGTVLAPGGGLLKQLLLPFRLRLGGRVGSGKQFVPWVTSGDAGAALVHVLTNSEVTGPVNVCAPVPVTNAELVRVIGAVLGKPALFPLPLAPLRKAFGPELVQETLLSSVRAVPAKLITSGFVFRDTDVTTTLSQLLKG